MIKLLILKINIYFNELKKFLKIFIILFIISQYHSLILNRPTPMLSKNMYL